MPKEHEKEFDQDKKVNRRNDRWLCTYPSNIPKVMHTKFPKSVMVLGVKTNKYHATPLIHTDLMFLLPLKCWKQLLTSELNE